MVTERPPAPDVAVATSASTTTTAIASTMPLVSSSSSSSSSSKGARAAVLPITDEILFALRGEEPQRLKIQTVPEPSIPVVEQFKGEVFPPGQIILYHQDNNTSRCTSEEKRYNERLTVDTLQSARHGAEVHRQVRQFMHSFIKPGLLMTEICETLEGYSRRLVKENGLHAGIAFPTGCSPNHVAAHYTPNTGDKTRLAASDVLKIDFGVHINGRIIDCAWTWAPDPKYKPLLDAVQDSTDTGIRTAGIDVRLCDVGAAVQEVMESYEIELDGKVFQIKSIRNLNGHSIDPYKIHGCKCLGRDTPVLMFDGTTKAVQDVHIGDAVMGDDGTKRQVLSTTAGRAAMFEIGSVHSTPFTCNGAHVLSLKVGDLPACEERDDGAFVVKHAAVRRDADGSVYDFDVVEQQFESATAARDAMCAMGTVVDIAVADVLQLDADKQRLLQTYRVAEPLQFGVDCDVEPFDDEWDRLPRGVKHGSVAVRERLLASVVDRCGVRDSAGGVTIALRNTAILEEIEFVARSLGKRVTRLGCAHKKRNYGGLSFDNPKNTTSLYIAPARGACNSEPLTIVALPSDDEYFGFALDGNRRFVLGGSFVVTHNSVPNVKGGDTTRMEEGEFYAIETFGSTGKGHVSEDGECSHFMKSFDVQHVPIRMTKAKQLLGHINRNFDTLAFCRRWLDRAGPSQYILALKNLCDLGIINKLPPLVDRKGSFVAQFEHTIFLRPTCKEVVSRGDDY